MVAGVLALVGGSILAYDGYQATAGPAGAVRGYFAALERSDASAALGFGIVPAGSRALLTAAVLHEQQKIAPTSHVHIVSSKRTGERALVTVRYDLGFGDGTQHVTDTTTVVHSNGKWRLAAAALATSLELDAASDRATIVGGEIPSGNVLMFPGAVPIEFDTPYLELAQATSRVQLAGPSATNLTVEVSMSGRAAVNAALAAALPKCLTGAPTADPRCPLPTPRAVPGTLRAKLVAALDGGSTLMDVRGAAGQIEASTRVKVLGSYQVLNFNNIAVSKRGTVSLELRATAYAQRQIVIAWQDERS